MSRSIGRIRTIVVQGYALHHLPLKVLCSLYVLSAMCVTTYLKAMLTDGFFAFRFFSCRKLRST